MSKGFRRVGGRYVKDTSGGTSHANPRNKFCTCGSPIASYQVTCGRTQCKNAAARDAKRAERDYREQTGDTKWLEYGVREKDETPKPPAQHQAFSPSDRSGKCECGAPINPSEVSCGRLVCSIRADRNREKGNDGDL